MKQDPNQSTLVRLYGAMDRALERDLGASLEVEALFGALPRGELQLREFLELRYRMQRWHRAMHLRYDLNSNPLFCSPRFGSAPSDLEPAEVLPIRPLFGNEWTFERWSQREGQGDYTVEGDAVWFRGRRFESGDFFLVDMRTEIGSALAAITDSETWIPHFSILILLERAGKKFPAVLEMYGHGLRAIPLNSFLSPRFSSYIEVYRLKQRPQGFASELDRIAKQMLTEPLRYDFYNDNRSPNALNCADLGTRVLERAGVDPIAPSTRLRDGVGKNFLWPLEMNFPEVFLHPASYVQSPRVEFVAVIDNGNLELDLARQVLVHELAKIISGSNGRIRTDRMPKMFHTKRKFVTKIHEGGWQGKLLLLLGGHIAQTMPTGSPEALAFFPPFQSAFAQAYSEISNYVPALIPKEGAHSLEDLQAHPWLALALQDALAPIRDWFQN